MSVRLLVTRARWKLASLLWPERLRPNKLVTRWRLRACQAEAVARWRASGGGSSGRHRPEARSQNGEDALLWDLLGDRERGFFVEAGAYDGYTFSVSYLFEGAGWNGVLVEALADRAAECTQRRTSSRVVNAALSSPGAPPTARFARDGEIEWNSALATDNQPGDTVELTTLDAVLEGHTGPIDFVVLDLEGHELAALEGFDLERWRPTALLIEVNEPGRAPNLRDHVEKRGYIYIASLDQNDLFLRHDEIALAQRLNPYWYDVGHVPPDRSNAVAVEVEGDAVSANLIRRAAHKPASDHEKLRSRLLRERRIDLVLDIGANEGSFALDLRASGYTGRIVSFEPLARVFAKLEGRSKLDGSWESLQLAVGSEPRTATLNIAGNWASSSLLPMDTRHLLAEPRSAYIGSEECEVVTLDGLGRGLIDRSERAYLKVDVQGSELDVLKGAEEILEQVEIIQAELSLLPLYDGAPLLGSVVRYLDERHFGLLALAPAFVHATTGAILQVDGIFARVTD
jgi:FkbM family methyltransferase